MCPIRPIRWVPDDRQSRPSVFRVARLAACARSTVVGRGLHGRRRHQPRRAPRSRRAHAGRPDASPPAGGFYLRAWQTQALAPQYTFGWLPAVTIAGRPVHRRQGGRPDDLPGSAVRRASSQTDQRRRHRQRSSPRPRPTACSATRPTSPSRRCPARSPATSELVVDGGHARPDGPVPTDAAQTPGAPGQLGAPSAAFWNKVGDHRRLARPPSSGRAAPYAPGEPRGAASAPPAEAQGGIAADENAVAAGVALRLVRFALWAGRSTGARSVTGRRSGEAPAGRQGGATS